MILPASSESHGPRQHRLLLLAVCLPCVALALLGARLIERETALEVRRVQEDRQRSAEEMSRAIVDQLQGVITAELSTSRRDAYVEEATVFVGKFEPAGLALSSSARARMSPADAAAIERLAADTATLFRIRGALGEPRIIAFDHARLLASLRYLDSGGADFLVVRTMPLLAAAGVSLGDSIELLPTARNGTVQLGDGIDGLWFWWRTPPGAVVAWRGPRLYYLVSLIVVGALGVLGVYLIARDVRRESRLSRLRQNFVAGVSHELKTPLTAIRVFAETLRDRPLAPATRDEYLTTMVDETDRLSRLVDNVLEFTRIERGDRVYRLREGDLADTVRRAVRALRHPLEQQGFHVRVDCPDCAPPVRFDVDAIEQVIVNLLANAMKYSGSSREIDVCVAALPGEVRVAVRDRGIGIAEADRKKIFERFYRSPSLAPDVTGTGLGLTLVQHIATAHGARITVDSMVGQGSTFNLYFPAAGAA